MGSEAESPGHASDEQADARAKASRPGSPGQDPAAGGVGAQPERSRTESVLAAGLSVGAFRSLLAQRVDEAALDAAKQVVDRVTGDATARITREAERLASSAEQRVTELLNQLRAGEAARARTVAELARRVDGQREEIAQSLAESQETARRLSAGLRRDVQELTGRLSAQFEKLRDRQSEAMEAIGKRIDGLDEAVAANAERQSELAEILADNRAQMRETAAGLQDAMQDRIEAALSQEDAAREAQAEAIESVRERLAALTESVERQAKVAEELAGEEDRQRSELESLAGRLGELDEEVAGSASRQAQLAEQLADDRRASAETGEGFRRLVEDRLSALSDEVRERVSQLAGDADRPADGPGPETGAPTGSRFSIPEPAHAPSTLEVNEVTFEDLRALRLSVTQAARVIAHRDAAGGFRSLDELDAVPGLPQSVLSELKERLLIGRPVDAGNDG